MLNDVIFDYGHCRTMVGFWVDLVVIWVKILTIQKRNDNDEATATLILKRFATMMTDGVVLRRGTSVAGTRFTDVWPRYWGSTLQVFPHKAALYLGLHCLRPAQSHLGGR